jgi:hypothetical protein
VDVRRHGISTTVYRAITLYLHEVKEGNRKDIYHFQSVVPVPAPDKTIKAEWQAILSGSSSSKHWFSHLGQDAWC